MKSTVTITILVALIFWSNIASAYLPGIAERAYVPGEQIPVRVNSLRSLSTLTPYDFYHLPYCQPKEINSKQESLGEILWGDRVMSSLYSVTMQVDVQCKLVQCMDKQANNEKVWGNVDVIEKFINEGYRGYMSIDNLPMFLNGTKNPIFGGRCSGDVPLEQRLRYSRGFAVGVNKACTGKAMLNNHLHFNVQYHQVPTWTGSSSEKQDNTTRYSVVGFTAVPYSVKHSSDGSSCNEMFNPTDAEIIPISTDDLRAKTPVYWSYSVKWTRNEKISWGNRWDAYLSTSFADANPSVHWQQIVISILLTMSLSTVAFTILMRTLHKDFNRYNSQDPDDAQEEVGWKLVHADVFRPPPYAHIFAGLVGNGCQLILLAGGVLCFTLLGTLSPANRGSLLTSLILMFALLSIAAGFICGHLLRLFERKEWKWVVVCGAFFPTTCYIVFFFTNLVNWHAGATTAVPFVQFFTLFITWAVFCIPLTILGASFAFHDGPMLVPLKIGKLAREIPAQRWYFSPPFTYIVPPIIPLAAAWWELKFILSSLWLNMVYYVFGFLALVCLVWGITVFLTTIIVIYFQLCYENYRWWWSSLVVPGGLGAHLFLYSIFYYFSELNIDTAAGTILYFSYMLLFSMAYGLAAGAIGFGSSFIFVKKIYSSIKID